MKKVFIIKEAFKEGYCPDGYVITLKSKNVSNHLEACNLCDLYHLCYHNMIDCELGLDEYWEMSEVKVQESI